jgi:hypothetical protein
MPTLRPQPPWRRPPLPEMPESRSLESQLGVPSCCLLSGRTNRRLYSEEKVFWQTREPLLIVSVSVFLFLRAVRDGTRFALRIGLSGGH